MFNYPLTITMIANCRRQMYSHLWTKNHGLCCCYKCTIVIILLLKYPFMHRHYHLSGKCTKALSNVCLFNDMVGGRWTG